MMTKTNKYKCPCCGHYTHIEKPEGNYNICPVCFWEDDPVQSNDPDYVSGANSVSLNEAKKNYNDFGACCKEDLQNVRPLYKDEINKEK